MHSGGSARSYLRISAKLIPRGLQPEPARAWPCIGRGEIVLDIVETVTSTSRGRAQRALVRGPLGGGKSRCLDEVADAVVARGRTIRRIYASAAVESIPFGAVAHMLPAGAREADDPVSLIGALRDVLAPRGAGKPVLVIDDLPLLDLTTAGVVASLANSDEILLVASARSGEAIPAPLVEVFLGERSLVVDLPAMSDDDISTLLQQVLGAPADGAVVVSLRERSDGNPLFIRELVRGAFDAGALHEVNGIWRLHGELPRSTRLREVVESRLEIIGPDERRAMELLALCDSVDIDELEGLVDLEALAQLEARGLLATVHRAGRLMASLAHPLHAEAIRVGVPAVRWRLLMRQHLAWLDEHPDSVHGDALQRAIWRLDAGLPTDIEQLLHGAALAAAALDSRSVLRLALPAFEMQPNAATGALVVDAQFQTGAWADAYVILDRAGQLDPTPSVRIDLALTRSTIQLWGLGDEAGALKVLEDLLHDPEMSQDDLIRIRAGYASVLVNAGRPGQAREILGPVNQSSEMRARLGAAVADSNSLAMAGRCDAALRAIDEALTQRPGHNLVAIADVDTHMVSKAFAHLEAGRLGEALQLATDGYELGVTNGRPLTQYWFTLLIARVHLLRGEVATALRQFLSARALGVDAGLQGPTRTALVGAVVSHALLGDAAAATALLEQLHALPAFGFMAPELGLADGWCSVARGDLVSARAALQAYAAEAEATGHVTSAVWLLHDAARLGCADDVAGRISLLAAGTDSQLAVVRAAHVRAMVTGDLHEMIAVADGFATMGANLLAAEALVAASALARGAGDVRLLRSLSARAAHHLGLCEGAATPGLIGDGGFVEPLTEREREIAFLAANGMKSREIAEQLYVSLRTVSNHLQHVYDKLGVRSREELRAALAPGEP